MLAYSDGSQFHFTAEPYSTWLMRWGGYSHPTPNNNMCDVEDPPYPTPIGHWQLRVEVTWAMRRTHPTLPLINISSWELKWHMQCGGPTLPYPPHWPSVVESWSDMCNVEIHPTLPPLVISSWQLKWHGDMCKRRTHPTLTPINHQHLRVEVTCVIWRPYPTLPSYWWSAIESCIANVNIIL